MKKLRQPENQRAVTRLLCWGICFLPSLLLAHPGHYHPDENDEFDAFRATVFHTHGALGYILAAVVISSIAVVCLNRKPAIRFSALAMAMASLSLLPIL